MMEVDPSNDIFKFPGTLSITSQEGNKYEKKLSVCLDNSKSLQFQVMRTIHDMLKAKLCKEPTSCSTKDDLNDFKKDDQVLELHMVGKVIRNAALKDGIYPLKYNNFPRQKCLHPILIW